MGRYFGTDGFRGESNIILNVTHAYKIGRFLGYYYGKKHKAHVVIGKDTRRSSYMFENALSAGLTASGADVYLLHVTTTPSVSYVIRSDHFDCGVMISASHNPYYDNGIKILNENGQKLEAEIEDNIEEYIDRIDDDLPFATREQIGKVTDYAVGRHRYIGYLMSLVTHSFKDIKIGLDCSNGSASSIAKGVFDTLGARTYVINNEPNGTNINSNCGSTHIEVLQQFVKYNHLDVGFAYDGDADRCLAVDDQGSIVDGDLILYICGCYLKEKGELPNDTVVTTIMSNLGLYKAFDQKDIKYEKTTVGDKYVFENMIQNGHGLGGEQSGHIIFRKYASTGDGILTSLMLMEVMLEKKMRISDLHKDITIYPQLLRNVQVVDKLAAKQDADVQKAVQMVEEALGENGRILLRESGTEPVLRIMVEAESDEICMRYVDNVVAVLKQKRHVLK